MLPCIRLGAPIPLSTMSFQIISRSPHLHHVSISSGSRDSEITRYFGPISSRIRGLPGPPFKAFGLFGILRCFCFGSSRFVKHTKTGNPLVDSVAEHQPARRLKFLELKGLISPVLSQLLRFYTWYLHAACIFCFEALVRS